MALYTSKAVAEVLGVTERRVRELRDEGVPVSYTHLDVYKRQFHVQPM